MQYARITTKCLLFVFTAASSAVAQTAPEQPDALDLLKSVELTYGAIINTTAMNGSDAQSKANVEQSVTVTADSTGKFRMESTDVMGMVAVYDGNTMWRYMPAANAYWKLPLNGASRSAEARASGMSGGANPLQEYKNITRGVKGGPRSSAARKSTPAIRMRTAGWFLWNTDLWEARQALPRRRRVLRSAISFTPKPSGWTRTVTWCIERIPPQK